jgi:hypothetical protein
MPGQAASNIIIITYEPHTDGMLFGDNCMRSAHRLFWSRRAWMSSSTPVVTLLGP